LEAEVSAAREAQVRLLPQRLPEVSEVGLAAACHPSRVVGGDFYDLFTLGEGRLAVLVAEGGNYGLGAALTIAYAKGFLMPRVAAAHTPVEIVSSLQERLAPMLEEGQELALVYAVFDVPARTLTYARAGRYPRVSISRGGRAAGAEGRGGAGPRLADGPEEQAVPAPAGTDPPDGFQINCAQVRLAPGDAVLFFTDAVAEGRGPGDGASFEGWVAKVLSRRPDGALQQLLDKELEKRARRMKKGGVEDDLTAVLVHLRPDVA
jgi:sigma-B regulation protein RsbU (phosphoserine phosphatase)